MSRLHVALGYDLRCPEDLATVPREELHRTLLEQATYADGNGVDSLVLSEHHDVDDGCLPSPVHLAEDLLYEASAYARWQSGQPSAMLDEVRSGLAEPLTFHPLIGGLDPDVSWECLRLLVEKVVPRLT